MDVGGAPAAVLLSPTGEAGWRATDPSYPPTDARSLLAYVEAEAGRYLVTSLVPPIGSVTEVGSLADARATIEAVLMPSWNDGSARSTGARGVRHD